METLFSDLEKLWLFSWPPPCEAPCWADAGKLCGSIVDWSLFDSLGYSSLLVKSSIGFLIPMLFLGAGVTCPNGNCFRGALPSFWSLVSCKHHKMYQGVMPRSHSSKQNSGSCKLKDNNFILIPTYKPCMVLEAIHSLFSLKSWQQSLAKCKFANFEVAVVQFRSNKKNWWE